jgi:hypothetical protein
MIVVVSWGLCAAIDAKDLSADAVATRPRLALVSRGQALAINRWLKGRGSTLGWVHLHRVVYPERARPMTPARR